MNKKLLLKDGTEFLGTGFGYCEDIYTEVVFNTSMSGYQETVSDNSYFGQAICFTYPLIGNYGINKDDFEGRKSVCDAVIVRDLCDKPAHYKCEVTFEQHLISSKIVGIKGIDTRKLTRHIREHGSMACAIVDIATDNEVVLEKLKNFKVTGHVSKVSSSEITHYLNEKKKIVVMDFGAKKNIIKNLIDNKYSVIVVGYDTNYEVIRSYNPDGILLSNGPGDPNELSSVVEVIKKLQTKYPMFGICLGHQLICLANNCTVSRLKFGHRGCNHPVKNLETNKIEITSQNHSYSVDNVSEELNVSHINLLDNSIEGVRHKKYDVFSVQYHPESCPGPNDSNYLFDIFYKMLDKEKDA